MKPHKKRSGQWFRINANITYRIGWLLLYTVPMNINGYVPFLTNMLDTIVRWVNMLTK